MLNSSSPRCHLSCCCHCWVFLKLVRLLATICGMNCVLLNLPQRILATLRVVIVQRDSCVCVCMICFRTSPHRSSTLFSQVIFRTLQMLILPFTTHHNTAPSTALLKCVYAYVCVWVCLCVRAYAKAINKVIMPSFLLLYYPHFFVYSLLSSPPTQRCFFAVFFSLCNSSLLCSTNFAACLSFCWGRFALL